MIREVTKDGFEKQVLKAKKIVMVDFFGPQCSQCLALMPRVEKLAKKYSRKLKVVKMNIVGNRMFCLKLQIMSLPTFLFYKNGKEIKRLTDNITPLSLEKAIKKLLEEKHESSD